MNKICLAAVALLFAGTGIAHAHITLDAKEAAIGASFKAVLRIPHGCAGAATTGLRVQLPLGFIGAKPMPKAGWQLDVISGPYSASVTNGDATVTEGPTEVRWSGGDLPDAFYDEFVVRGTLASSLQPGTRLFFPIIQQCGDASEDWIEIPVEGHSEPEMPAPGVLLVEGAAASGHTH
jgi:uncharacterized protein YcnI